MQEFAQRWPDIKEVCLAIQAAERTVRAEGMVKAECEIVVQEYRPNHTLYCQIYYKTSKGREQKEALYEYMTRDQIVRIRKRDNDGVKRKLFEAVIKRVETDEQGVPTAFVLRRILELKLDRYLPQEGTASTSKVQPEHKTWVAHDHPTEEYVLNQNGVIVRSSKHDRLWPGL